MAASSRVIDGKAPPRGRGRGRGSFPQSRRYHFGETVSHEVSDLERLAHKFCGHLYGKLRFETAQHAECERSNNDLNGRWLLVKMREEEWFDQGGHDPSIVWRTLREKLEAVTVMSVLACTRSYAWRRNQSFWRRFMAHWDHHDDKCFRQSNTQADVTPASRDDTRIPRFMVDFSYINITPDIVTLLRHVLLGSEKSMRLSFKIAMETLSTVSPRSQSPVVIQIALRFARCQFQGGDIVKRLVDLVKDVRHCRTGRERELGNATSKAFYFHVVEFDLGGVCLTNDNLHQLRAISQESPFRLVLDDAVSSSPDLFTPFGAMMGSWLGVGRSFDSKKKCESGYAKGSNATSISDLSLNSNALSSFQIASLFSALHYSELGSVQRLSLCGIAQRANSRVFWAWTAFGLWCDDSRSKLASLDLSSNAICREDVAVIHQILTTQQELRARVLHSIVSISSPSSSATGEGRKEIRSHRQRRREKSRGTESAIATVEQTRWVQLDQGTLLATQHLIPSPELLLTTTIIVPIVGEIDGSTAVLVPAYGYLWVKSSATKPSDPPQLSTASESMLQELRLNSMFVLDENFSAARIFEALFSALALPKLTKLELDNNSLDSKTLTAVLAACPALQVLSLEDCKLTSIAPIMAAYRGGSCSIERLNVADNQIADGDIVDLCRFLARSSSTTCRLRVLCLHHNPIGSRALHALSHAIRVSPTLVHLTLNREQDKDAHYRTVFYPLHDRFMRVEPLSSAHERAFQRALMRRLGATALDASIVASILAFAASSLHRRIDWV